MPKETQAQRRARELAEVAKQQAQWEAERPVRLLQALALARDLGVEARVYNRYVDEMYYSFRFDDCVYSEPVVELGECAMNFFEGKLQEERLAQQRRRHLDQVRQDTLAELSDEQKEALGLL